MPALAVAHPGHAEGLAVAAGALHPLTGADHLAALLAVGAWSTTLADRARTWVPAAFLVAMGLGSALAPALFVPAGVVEQGIAASLLLLGLLLAFQARLAAPATVGLAATFALFHGAAHGLEAPGAAVGYTAGFLLASALLIAVGFAATTQLTHRLRSKGLRIGGALLAGSGLLLLG
ncbi:HupE/UreJ family protein [bacterium]|nr:MAG: HupE/UreJ family protein [bacterium]